MSRSLFPEMQALIAQRSATSTTSPTLADRRAAWSTYSRTIGGERPPELQVRDFTIEASGLRVPVRLYLPDAEPGAPLPCAVYFHGGGFVLGDLDSSDFVAWGICVQARCAVVSVDYPLSPEHPFPAAFDAGLACVEWIAQHGADIGVDGSRLVLAGDSAGGNLAAAICIAARDRGGPAILGQALAYPWLSGDGEWGSRAEFSTGFGLTMAGLNAYMKDYLGGQTSPEHALAFPLNATHFDGLPPALIHVAECDPVRDDGRRFAARMIEAGCDVHYREAPGSVHAFLRARFLGPHAAAEFERFTAFVRARLWSPHA